MVEVVPIELESLKDLIRLACSLGLRALYRAKADEEYLYMAIYGLGSVVVTPYIKTSEKLDGEYIIYNTSTGEVKASHSLVVEPREAAVALVNIKKQNLIKV